MDASLPLFPRALAPAVEEALADTPVVCLLGPRQSGKTTLARSLAPDRAFVSLDEHSYHETAANDPAGFVASLPDVVTLDEVQRVPALLPAIKHAVDRDRRPGRFLLTGSADLLLAPTVTEPPAGRMEVVQLHPLTESEKARHPGGPGRPAGGRRVRRTAGTAAAARPSMASPIANKCGPSSIGTSATWRGSGTQATSTVCWSCWRCTPRNPSTPARWPASPGCVGIPSDRHVAILERLYLVRRLPAWRRGEARRLVKSAKAHLLDGGLAATLAGLTAADWLHRRDRMGRLLESFVVQQLVAQAGWTDPDLRFWHFRENDQVEVDLVVTRGRQTWGIEVKAAGAVTPRDGRGLVRLADRCRGDFEFGLVLYAGRDVLPLRDASTLAVPLSALWAT